jgi:PadR family transcriptional regulator, regulatory protein PadR
MMEYSSEGIERRITQLRKGILELAIMGVLRHERHYGYSLVRVLSQAGPITLKEGTIYPILGRLDREGLIRSEWVMSDQGPPRKYYALTAAGRRLFNELSQEFELLAELVQHKWQGAEQPNAPIKKTVARKA